MSLVFIVSTGRCGSTLVSRMLHAHPDVLILSEFHAFLVGAFMAGRAFPLGELDADQFWHLLNDPNRGLEDLLRKGARIPEILYHYEDGLFNLRTGVPPLLYSTLPLLTNDPDGLFLELSATLRRWPQQPVAGHYRRVFRWLADRFTRSIVVERSGGSLAWLPELRMTFPDAKFVHLYRNGPDCALSMSKHAMFRLVMEQRKVTEIIGPVGWNDGIEEERVRRLPEHLKRVALGRYDVRDLLSADIPPAIFGRMWSDNICAGMVELKQLPSTTWTPLSFESLLSRPAAELTRLARFIGMEATPAWLGHAARQVDPSRPGGADQLDGAALTRLREACAPGTQALQLTNERIVP